MKKGLFVFVMGLAMLQAFSQKKVVVIGSSTAAGQGASTYANSFVGRLIANYPSHTFVNLARGGTVTYQALPSGTNNGSRPPVDPTMNITAAISLGANIILVAFPTNDIISNYTNEETLNNLKKIYQTAWDNGVWIYIIGTQPRNLFSAAQRLQGVEQNNLILSSFAGSINIYDQLVSSDGTNSIDPLINVDDTHVNDEGHRRIFQRIVNTDIFKDFTVLPVHLTRFTAKRVGVNVNLAWETGSENNNSHFLVERSSNGKDFTTIGTVKGKGNSNKATAYSFTDASPLPLKIYYRLIQVDLDGKKQLSQVVAVNATSAAIPQAAIFPVPAHDIINIVINASQEEKLDFSITDIRGAKIANYKRTAQNGANTFKFPVNTLANGQYILQVQKQSGSQNLSFIKN